MLALAIVVSQLFFETCSFGNPERVRQYIDAGVNLEARDEGGRTALMCAAQDNPDPNVILALVRAGANVEARVRGNGAKKWRTPLMLASANNNYQVVSALLKSGAAVEARDAEGFTPILLAKLYNPDPEAVVKLLLRAGANLLMIENSQDREE